MFTLLASVEGEGYQTKQQNNKKNAISYSNNIKAIYTHGLFQTTT